MAWKDIQKSSDYLSHTQISMYRRCPKQYEFRYVKGMKKPPTSALILGSSVHKGIEHNYINKFKKKKQAPMDEVMDQFADAFDNSKSGANFEGKNQGDVKDMGYRMSQVHYEQLAPTVQPLELPEKEFLVPIPNVKKKVKGFIDIISSDKGRKIILDNKTSQRKKDPFDVHVDDQLTMYAYAEKKTTGKAPKLLGFDVMVGNKTGVTPQRIITTRGEERFSELENTIQMVDKGINSGIFPPTSNAQVCSWCGYSEVCVNAKNAYYDRKTRRGDD